ncbi:cytokine receptor common subunit beta-like isoform X2 [Ascaphus truei]|uniref:cytokine receptor common subunit beta-like isoform X2 n=1 Tax=Ascaphus truei TaxID=8439 RepID=UPI003F5A3E1A
MKTCGGSAIVCYIAVHVLSTCKETRGTTLLDSLQCDNDYHSHVTCTWKENQLSRQFVNMSLYRWDTSGRQNGTCHPTEPARTILSDLLWTCHTPRKQSTFIVSLVEKYTFLPDRNLESHIHLNLSNKDSMQVGAPIIYINEVGNLLLWWKDPYSLTPENQTQCDVNYKQESETWEDSSSGECVQPWGVIRKDLLAPGVRFVARVRTKPRYEDRWGNWSSEVLLERQTADEARPQNLRCTAVGDTLLTCSWEVRLEVAGSVSFSLFYKHHLSGREVENPPSCRQEVPGRPYLSCRCDITTADWDPLELHVIRVRPKQEVKRCQVCLHIRVPAGNITMEAAAEGIYKASWSRPDHLSGNWYYQLCYGKVAPGREMQPVAKEGSPDCLNRLINITNGHPERSFSLSKHLEPSSLYYIKVRKRVAEDKPDDCFNGPWSEWSLEHKWRTSAVTDLRGLYALIPICAIVFMACCLYGYTYLARSKKKWEDMTPNPGQSKLMIHYLQKTIQCHQWQTR